MNTIILATDFSEIAQNAANYAVEMGKHTGSSLILLHAYQPVFAGETSMVNMQELEVVKEIAESSMEAERKRVEAIAGKNFVLETFISPGSILGSIRDLYEERKPMLVIMGSSGASGGLLWGSTSSAAFRELNIPVLAIPAGIQWEPVKNLCFAVDYKNIDDPAPVHAIGYWLRIFHAKLFMLHVNKPGQQTIVPDDFQQAFTSLDPVFVNVENDDLEKGVQDFLSNHAVDWLVIMPHKHNFFERLLGTGSTKKLAHINTHPILAVHE